jgi:hypothetical protein
LKEHHREFAADIELAQIPERRGPAFLASPRLHQRRTLSFVEEFPEQFASRQQHRFSLKIHKDIYHKFQA